jgi:hypothetical protein
MSGFVTCSLQLILCERSAKEEATDPGEGEQPPIAQKQSVAGEGNDQGHWIAPRRR